MADALVEKVARALDPHVWDRMLWMYAEQRERSLAQARAVLAVVADDVDGFAGVLRAHGMYIRADGATWCTCKPREWYPTVLDATDHQATMLAAYIRGGA